MPVTGNTNGHTHSFTKNATRTSEVNGHSHSLPNTNSGQTGLSGGHRHSFNREKGLTD